MSDSLLSHQPPHVLHCKKLSLSMEFGQKNFHRRKAGTLQLGTVPGTAARQITLPAVGNTRFKGREQFLSEAGYFAQETCVPGSEASGALGLDVVRASSCSLSHSRLFPP